MNKKALVTDDDVYCLDTLVEYLSDKEFDISSSLTPTCSMIKQNLETCPMQAPCYDIVFSDYHMPEMTGQEFFEYQRQRGCKILPGHKALISGGMSPKDQSIAESRGYKFFRKPTPLDLIDSWIDEVLAKDSRHKRDE